ncbi:MAG: hypothetical protein Hyperionvirus3_176 [Hyperionvirus sp.]|uniref:Uncharacterized protein n=1 Tax=Hyperionvirus sp. TaxID=2487770 RepID=A0A3G5A6Z6_9VIRU|nr:MAG: hypothetical protein Hyperionvirus3_176 [Hyperionvirus sp.]
MGLHIMKIFPKVNLDGRELLNPSDSDVHLLKRLKWFSLYCGGYSHNTGDGLSVLTNLVDLTLTDLSSKHLTASALHNLINLTSLTIFESHGIKDDALTRLVSLKKLELNHTSIQGTCLAFFENLTSLRVASRKFLPLAEPMNLTNLETLEIDETDRHPHNADPPDPIIHPSRIRDNLFRMLTKLTALTIDIHSESSANITDYGLSTLHNLTQLRIGSTNTLTNRCFIHLTNLKCLEIMECPEITDEGISHLKYLTHIMFDTTNITGSCFSSFVALDTLDINSCDIISDKDISHLKLRDFRLFDCPHVTDAGINSLTNLTRLTIYNDDDQYSDAAIKSLDKLKKLTIYGGDQKYDIAALKLRGIEIYRRI